MGSSNRGGGTAFVSILSAGTASAAVAGDRWTVAGGNREATFTLSAGRFIGVRTDLCGEVL